MFNLEEIGIIGDNDCVCECGCNGGGGGSGGGDWGGEENIEIVDAFGVVTPLVALVVLEGSGNLYLIKVAVVDGGCGCDKGTGCGCGCGCGCGWTDVRCRGACRLTGTGPAGVFTGAIFLKIIRLFRILTNPRSNVIYPFNISLVDEMYDSTKL